MKWLPFFLSSCLLTHIVKADSQSNPFTQEHHVVVVPEGVISSSAEPTSELFEGTSLIQTSGVTGSSEISKTTVNDEAAGSRRRTGRSGSTRRRRRRRSAGGGDALTKEVESLKRTLNSIDRRVRALERKGSAPSPPPRDDRRRYSPPRDDRRRYSPPSPPPDDRRRRRSGGGGGGGGGAGGGTPGKKPTSVPDRWVNAHNYYRCIHNAPPIRWDTAFARGAQKWADRGQMSHAQCYKIPPPEGPAGENLASGSAGYMTIEKASYNWWNESPGSAPNCGGHCTAMLWKAATKLGCGIGKGGMGDLLVCRYGGGNPLPNMAGAKQAQVGRLDNSKKAACKKK